MKILRPAPYNIPITSGFGPRKPPTPGASAFHKGIDFGGQFKVTAAANGKVVSKGYNATGYGNYLIIQHTEITLKGRKTWRTTYDHGETPSTLKIGDKVKAGERIFISGSTGISTGIHLHFELQLKKGSTFVPVDPAPYFVDKLEK